MSLRLVFVVALAGGCAEQTSVSTATQSSSVGSPVSGPAAVQSPPEPLASDSPWAALSRSVTVGPPAPKTAALGYVYPKQGTRYAFRTRFVLRPKVGAERGSVIEGELVTVEGVAGRWNLLPEKVVISARIKGQQITQPRPWLAEPFELLLAPDGWTIAPKKKPEGEASPAGGHAHGAHGKQVRIGTAGRWAAGIGLPLSDLFPPLSKGGEDPSWTVERVLAGGPGSVSGGKGGSFRARQISTKYTVKTRLSVDGVPASIIEAEADAPLADGHQTVKGRYVLLASGEVLHGWIQTRRSLKNGYTIIHTGELRRIAAPAGGPTLSRTFEAARQPAPQP